MPQPLRRNHIINTSYFENSTRTVWSSTSPIDFFGTLNVAKISSTSKLLVEGQVMTKNIWSYANNWYFVINGTTYNGRGGWNDTANSGTNATSFTRGVSVGPLLITGLPSGTIPIILYAQDNNGTSFSSGSLVINPNSSDDGRYNQQVSSLVITEIQS